MLTNLPEDETVLFHPIVFFDQGTYFFETRRRLDGAALLGCGLAGSNGTWENGTCVVMDPIEPLRRLDAECAAEGSGYTVRCSGVGRGSWGLLAMLGPAEMERVKAAAGELPERPAGFSDDEWLLRHAFADERVRENSFLAATLARLPMIFARATEGCIQFRMPRIETSSRSFHAGLRLVAVVDAGTYHND
jgi:hypothetical protein